jgi:TRAP-type C4-dicarboxylate transport system permease large subunit
VALNVFVIAGIAKDVPVATIFRGITPFLVAMVVLMILLTVWPDLALILPRNMK